MAALLTVARFCGQRSELGVAEHWYDTTALDDLPGVDTALARVRQLDVAAKKVFRGKRVAGGFAVRGKIFAGRV